MPPPVPIVQSVRNVFAIWSTIAKNCLQRYPQQCHRPGPGNWFLSPNRRKQTLHKSRKFWLLQTFFGPPKMYLVSQPWLLGLEGHRTLSTVPTFCQHYPGISAHWKSFWIYEICNIIHEPSLWPAAPSLWTMSRKTALLAQRGPQGEGTLCRNAHEYVLKQRDWRQGLPHFRHLLWPKLGPILPLLLEQLQNSKWILSSWVSLFYL